MMGREITLDQLRQDVGLMIEKITHVTLMFRQIKLTMEEYVCLKVIIMLNQGMSLKSVFSLDRLDNTFKYSFYFKSLKVLLNLTVTKSIIFNVNFHCGECASTNPFCNYQLAICLMTNNYLNRL